MRFGALLVLVILLGGCAPDTGSGPPSPSSVAAPAPGTVTMLDEPDPSATPAGAQPKLAADPAELADDLVADEQALRDPATSEPARVAAAHRQQAAYRAIGRRTEWDAIVRPRISSSLSKVYDLNIDARRQLAAMAPTRDTVPPWRIVSPPPADELVAYYHDAEQATGVGWNYLAAINFVETRFGSVDGVSTAGAQGPMQFLPSTFAAYGEGGDIRSPRDSIMAAGRYLAANGFVNDRDRALFRYNNSAQYVRAVNDYAELIAADPAALGSYYRWDVYYYTVAGDVLLPIGYVATEPIPVDTYLAAHPQ
jgi:soluble lytic murein transglycosylase-like protein